MIAFDDLPGLAMRTLHRFIFWTAMGVLVAIVIWGIIESASS